MIAVVDSDCSSVESPVYTVGGVPVISVALSRCMDVVGAVLKRRCQILPAQGVSEGVPEQEKPLTPRESEIMDQIAKGSSLKEISYTLGISYHTVNAHKRNLFLKTGARTLRQLSLYAILHARTGAG